MPSAAVILLLVSVVPAATGSLLVQVSFPAEESYSQEPEVSVPSTKRVAELSFNAVARFVKLSFKSSPIAIAPLLPLPKV